VNIEGNQDKTVAASNAFILEQHVTVVMNSILVTQLDNCKRTLQ